MPTKIWLVTWLLHIQLGLYICKIWYLLLFFWETRALMTLKKWSCRSEPLRWHVIKHDFHNTFLLQLFELDNVVSRDCCRIVKYDDFQDTLECSFEEEEGTSMEKLLGGVKQSYSFDLLLETKRPEQKFQAYKPGGIISGPVTIQLFQCLSQLSMKFILLISSSEP